MFKKLVPLTMAASVLCSPVGLSAKTDRLTSASYQTVSKRLLEYYSLSEAEAQKRREQSMSIDEMIKDNNRRAKKALQNDSYSFELSTSERISASYNALRTLNFYRQDPALLASLMRTVDDLEFFNTANGGLFKELDKTKTTNGSLVLASMLLNPLVDMEAIKTRNALLRELATNDTLRRQMERLVAGFASVQDEVLSFWANDININIAIDKKLYFSDETKNNESNLNLWYHYLPGMKVVAAMGTLVSGVQVARGLAGFLNKRFAEVEYSYGWRDIYEGEPSNPALLTGIGATAVSTGLVIKWLWDSHANEKEHRELIRLVRNRGMALGRFIKTAKGLSNLVQGSESLTAGLKNAALFKNFVEDADAYDDNFKDIKDSLLSNTVYEGEKDKPCSDIGLVLVNDRKIRLSLASFARMFELVGEIDAYLSIANLLRLEPVNGTKFSIPVPVVDDSMDPKLSIKDFWHPMISRDTVVTNSIALENSFRGIVLTGSNTGGKSTALKSMLISALLGQSWGIYPGSEMEFTPFSFIGSFMNVTDNIAERASLFQSEVDRAKNLIHVGKDVARSEGFGLVVMDELFTGTNPEKGEQGTNYVANKLFMNTRLITLFATHYKTMTEIPGNNFGDQVKNYKIDVAPHPEKKGRFVHTYKLVEGISSVDFAEYLFERDL